MAEKTLVVSFWSGSQPSAPRRTLGSHVLRDPAAVGMSPGDSQKEAGPDGWVSWGGQGCTVGSRGLPHSPGGAPWHLTPNKEPGYPQGQGKSKWGDAGWMGLGRPAGEPLPSPTSWVRTQGQEEGCPGGWLGGRAPVCLPTVRGAGMRGKLAACAPTRRVEWP